RGVKFTHVGGVQQIDAAVLTRSDDEVARLILRVEHFREHEGAAGPKVLINRVFSERIGWRKVVHDRQRTVRYSELHQEVYTTPFRRSSPVRSLYWAGSKMTRPPLLPSPVPGITWLVASGPASP